MQRLIVMSAAYRQASVMSPQLAENGSGESTAGPRPARAAAGRIDSRSGFGRERFAESTRLAWASVFPYQPDGLWDETGLYGTYSAWEVHAQPRARFVPANDVYLLEADRAAAIAGHL